MPSAGHRRTGKPRGNPNWRKHKEADSTPITVNEDATTSTDDETPTPVDGQEDAVTLQVEDAPDEDEAEPLTWQEKARMYARQALDKAGFTRGDSGAASSDGGRSAAPTGGKLNKRQQEFAETITPMFVGALILGMKWVYTRRGVEYAILAPTDDQATKMVTPLIRIWARRAKAGGISPDTLDMMACLGACFAYGRSVQARLPQVQAGQSQQEQPQHESNPYDERRSADEYYAQFDTSTNAGHDLNPYEAGYSGRDTGYGDASGAAPGSQADGGRDGLRGTVSLDHLTERERTQYQKLLELRQRDFNSRARRSGNVRIVGGSVRGGHQRMGRRAG